jgi:hypothetical protein
VSCRLCKFIAFSIFVSINILYSESLEKKFRSSDQSQVFFEGGLSGDAFIFYLPCCHLGVYVKIAHLNADGP